MCADFLLLLDDGGRDFDEGIDAAEENDGGVEGGSREKPTGRGGEEEEQGSEVFP